MIGNPMRLVVAMFGALVLALGSLPCEAQAMPDDCDMPAAGSTQHDKQAPLAGPDCALGCRLAPQTEPSLSPPVRIAYAVSYVDSARPLAGITLAPDAPVPRRMT